MILVPSTKESHVLLPQWFLSRHTLLPSPVSGLLGIIKPHPIFCSGMSFIFSLPASSSSLRPSQPVPSHSSARVRSVLPVPPPVILWRNRNCCSSRDYRCHLLIPVPLSCDSTTHPSSTPSPLLLQTTLLFEVPSWSHRKCVQSLVNKSYEVEMD